MLSSSAFANVTQLIVDVNKKRRPPSTPGKVLAFRRPYTEQEFARVDELLAKDAFRRGMRLTLLRDFSRVNARRFRETRELLDVFKQEAATAAQLITALTTFSNFVQQDPFLAHVCAGEKAAMKEAVEKALGRFHALLDGRR